VPLPGFCSPFRLDAPLFGDGAAVKTDVGAERRRAYIRSLTEFIEGALKSAAELPESFRFARNSHPTAAASSPDLSRQTLLAMTDLAVRLCRPDDAFVPSSDPIDADLEGAHCLMP